LVILQVVDKDLDDPEHERFTSSSSTYVQSEADAVRRMSGDALETKLKGPVLGAASNDVYNQALQAIIAEAPIPYTAKGERDVRYDVILQPGHYGRPPGLVGTAGAKVSERALVKYITRQVADDLMNSGYRVLVVSADGYLKPERPNGSFHGLQSKVFLAIHADGSRTPCTTGPSLGYKRGSNPFAMHALGWSLTKALGYSYTDFARDNFTANESHYYMFSQVNAPTITGLLEVGELTCPEMESKLIGSSRSIGINIAEGIKYIIGAPTQ
jgi:N-acetylmuramoyl-L-alanine amidase